MEENKLTKQENDALAIFGKGKTIYQVAGNDVALSFDIVRNYLTKGNGQVSDQDIVQFISICKFNQLNPFLNEAFLVKFGQQPALNPSYCSLASARLKNASLLTIICAG